MLAAILAADFDLDGKGGGVVFEATIGDGADEHLVELAVIETPEADDAS